MEGGIATRYTYDSWGNVIDIENSDNSVNHIGNVNSVRYRGYYWDEETGLYYVGSRYYDPDVGRWINADSYISTGQGIIGNNMYAYCLNNHINNIDMNGMWTFSVSIVFSGVLAFGKSISYNFVVDNHGNFDTQYTQTQNDSIIFGLCGMSAGVSLQYTKANTVYDLYGNSTVIGGSISIPVKDNISVGADIISFTEESIDGWQLTIAESIGLPYDVHVEKTTTTPWTPGRKANEEIVDKIIDSTKNPNTKQHGNGKCYRGFT